MPLPADMPEDSLKMFTAMMQVGWLMPLVGAIEVVGGVLFIISRFRALGAIIILPVMVGIVITNIAISPEGLPIVLPLLAIQIWAMVENREKYLPLIK